MSFPTQDEIVARILARRSEDIFGFETCEYVDWLDFEHAKQFLTDEATAELWQQHGRPFEPTPERAIQAIMEYMPFAWEKANDCRGISALRSLAHMRAWLWLSGEKTVADFMIGYTHYGKPQLRAICQHFGINYLALDDGCWRNDEGADWRPAHAVDKINLPWRTPKLAQHHA